MRYLAIDLGGKRTGLAFGDDLTGIATPLDVIESASQTEIMRQISNAITEYEPDQLVLGLPLNMDDTEGPAAKSAREFAARLTEQFGLTVNLHDERKTSEQADEHMAQSGLTHKQKKRRRDALAAAMILQGYLDLF